MYFQKPPLGTPLDWENPLNKGTVMALAMNEGHGDKVQDLSMNGNHGTLRNVAFPSTHASGWNPGQTGTGLKFDGANDDIQISDGKSTLAGDAITFSALCYIESFPAGYARICNKGWATAGSFTMMRDSSNNKMRFAVTDGSNTSTATSAVINLNEWVNLVGTYDGNRSRIYVNGNLSGSLGAILATTIGNVSDLFIGSSGTSLRFDGWIDQPRMMSRAWSAKEVKDYAINPWRVYLDE